MKGLSMLWFIFMMNSVLTPAFAQNDTDAYLDPKNDCPSPLIVVGPDISKDSQNCLNGCCLPCPYPNNFYKENQLETTYKAFAIIGIISFFFAMLVSIFFVILPSQKQNPLSKIILLPLSLSVMFYEGSEFFTVNQQKTLCYNEITPAVPNNNAYCAAQAFFTLSGSYALACYSSLLMMHLHLISVWRSEFITKRILLFHLLIVGGSLAAFIIPYATDNIQSTNICFISLNAAPAYFYFLFFIYIAFAAHLATFIYMAHITFKSNRSYSVRSNKSSSQRNLDAQRKLDHIKTIFKIQWRALLGAILMLIIYVLNWHLYVAKFNASTLNSQWILDWIICLKDYGSQNSCAIKAEPHVPDSNFLIMVLFFNRSAGLLIFIIFAAKKSILLELYYFIRGKSNSANISFFETESTRSSIRKSKFNFNDVETFSSSEPKVEFHRSNSKILPYKSAMQTVQDEFGDT